MEGQGCKAGALYENFPHVTIDAAVLQSIGFSAVLYK